MRYCLVLGVVGLGVLAADVAAKPAMAAARDDLWLADYATARRAARLTGKPIFVVFR